ncbi:hypothetical protein DAPPUDRAFT_240946 [Daphnia pulex]|uniref:Uncharacterized protein n=1 Tax=Daphnia pulex TaxID=6669 RepID=E9GD09_DAPPU|nr:hypothetical protein DAPPUDRAFT_240946 [Daphnia pulex]|eukprot:EFX82773.1 hypothetical protein DAPPUDRAFT_240946 [Daphnia pulex]
MPTSDDGGPTNIQQPCELRFVGCYSRPPMEVQPQPISVKRAFVIVGSFIDSDMPVSAVRRCGFNNNRGV